AVRHLHDSGDLVRRPHRSGADRGRRRLRRRPRALPRADARRNRRRQHRSAEAARQLRVARARRRPRLWHRCDGARAHRPDRDGRGSDHRLSRRGCFQLSDVLGRVQDRCARRVQPVARDRKRLPKGGRTVSTNGYRTAKGGTLVLGGGFGGAYVARLLAKDGATIVSPNTSMLYTPLLPEVSAGSIEPRHVVVPLRAICPHAEIVRGHAVALDEAAQTVRVETALGAVDVEYERLVVALGAVPRTLPIRVSTNTRSRSRTSPTR